MIEQDSLGEEFVRLALRAAEHHPILKAVYLGPPEWLEEARRHPGDLASLAASAHELSERASGAGDHYIAGECRAVATQLEVVAGRSVPYEELVGILLGVKLVPPDRDEVSALRAEVLELAAEVAGRSGPEAVTEWEGTHSLTGEDKWNAALDAYRLGRRYAFGGSFPLPVTEGLDLVRATDALWSMNLTWYPPSRLMFEINVDTPRTAATTAFEVAHNIYPGDYLHLATLTQHTYGRRGRLAASIKLKNAPENVIAEGVEDVAYLKLFPEPSAEQRLVCRLEWLRRAASIEAALAVHVDRITDEAAVKKLMSEGFMDEGRARFQLRFIKHQLWGTYQYTYWAGRKLVQAGEERARRGGREREYLEYLYTELHVPDTFLTGLDKLLDAGVAAQSAGRKRDPDGG
jgi:hypothetical protein